MIFWPATRLCAFSSDSTSSASRYQNRKPDTVGTNFEDLLVENLKCVHEADPRCSFDGRLVLSHPPKKAKHQITDISTWTDFFSIFLFILCTTAYCQDLVIQTPYSTHIPSILQFGLVALQCCHLQTCCLRNDKEMQQFFRLWRCTC